MLQIQKHILDLFLIVWYRALFLNGPIYEILAEIEKNLFFVKTYRIFGSEGIFIKLWKKADFPLPSTNCKSWQEMG